MSGLAVGGKWSGVRLLMGLACVLAPGIAAADGAPRAAFAAWAIGLPDGYIMMEYQAAVIEVTAEDVARGVVEVRGGSRLIITTRSPAGYAVDFYPNGKLFQPVQIEGIGSAGDLGATDGTAVQREVAAGRCVIVLNYRFLLAPGAAPGTYAWPLEMVVRQMVSSDVARPSGAFRFVTVSRQPRAKRGVREGAIPRRARPGVQGIAWDKTAQNLSK